MKTWLKQNKSRLLAAALAVLAFIVGWWAGQIASDHRAYAALWEAIVTLPDPGHCALCGEITRRHALCLIDLSTGEMDALTVYQAHPARPWELLPMDRQPAGTFNFQPCAGLMGIRDTCTHTCTVLLPEEHALMDPARFCRGCRELLAGAGREGYVVLDPYDPDHVRAYPVRRNGSQVVRDYRVTVERTQNGAWALCVNGLL